MKSMLEIITTAVESKASDIFTVAGAYPSMKIDGVVTEIGSEKLTPEQSLDLVKQVYEYASRSIDKLMYKGDDDFSFSISRLARFRVNAYRQRGSYAMVIRIVFFEIPSYTDLALPEEIMDLASLKHGMILVTGTAGSGKSTTEACLIDRINKTRSCHVITLEDPIEYLYRNDKSIISQREISIDTEDFAAALRACLRQAPDVIQVGEMRDVETIRAAVTAAETGHLLVATLHTSGAVNSIDRIIDSFPSEGQHQIRTQLSMVLNTVVSQRLLPAVGGGRIPAFEIMKANNAIRAMIRDSKTHMIDNAIFTGAADGMVTMDQYIATLYKKGKITKQTALDFCNDPEQMRKRIF